MIYKWNRLAIFPGEATKMPRPRFSVLTPMLLVVIAGLIFALVVQQREHARRVAALHADIDRMAEALQVMRSGNGPFIDRRRLKEYREAQKW